MSLFLRRAVGLRLCVRKTHPDLQIILGTGYADLPPGADRYLVRPSKPSLKANWNALFSEAVKGKRPFALPSAVQ